MLKILNIKKSIAATLLVIVFSAYFLIAVIITALHIYVEYKAAKKDIEEDLGGIFKTMEQGLSNAMWEMNDSQLSSLVNGMINLPDVIGVLIEDEKGDRKISAGIILNKNATPFDVEKDTPLPKSRKFYFSHFSPLNHIKYDKEVHVGGVTIFSDSDAIFARIKTGIYLLIVDTILKILTLGLIIIIVVHFFLTIPLSKFTNFINDLNFSQLKNLHLNIQTKGNNELKVLESAFNNMITNLSNALNKQKEAENSLRKSEKKYRDIFENAIEGLYQSTPSGKFINVNHAMANFFGLSTPEELLQSSKNSTKLYYKNPGERDRFQREVKEKKSIRNFIVEYLRPDGTSFWASESARGVYDEQGNLQYYEGSMIDITQKKEKEDAERAREAAEIASKTKSAFLANMSHEIRTPMNAIIGLTDLCLLTDLDPQQNDYLTKIAASAKSLLGIINDILDISKIEAGKLTIENIPFNLEEILHNISNVISYRASSKGIEFIIYIDPDVPFYLVGDPLRLTQILLNLGNNSVKFTEYGQILIKVEVEKGDLTDHQITLKFSINDSGIGMTEEQEESVFDSFQQADTSTTRKYGGTGLGLSICKNLVELMGGKIWVKSELQVGTNFYFTIPLGINTDIEQTDQVIPEELYHLKVLIVSENLILGETMKEICDSLTFIATLAETEKQTISLVEKNQYNLIILNDSFIKANFQFLMKIKEKNQYNSKIIVLGSPTLNQDLKKKALTIGVHNFLDKPATGSSLYNVVLECLEITITEYSQQPTINITKHDHPISDTIRGANILIIEDNEINQQIIKEILEREKFYTTLANNGQEGILKIEEAQYDLVFMDIQMPGMDGYETTKIIRKTFSQKDLPIVAMTAHAMDSDREKSLLVGMNDFISKPIILDQLYEVLNKYIEPKSRPIPTFTKNEAPTDLLPDTFPGFELKKALFNLNNHEFILINTMKLFLKNNKNFFIDLLMNIDKKDWNLVNRNFHSLKGLTATIGAESLSKLCYDLEKKTSPQAMKNSPFTKEEPLLSQFQEQLAEVLASINSISHLFHLPDQEENKDYPIYSELSDQIDNLLKHLAEGNFSAIEMIKSLKQYDQAKSFTKELEKIENLAAQFDFEEALVQLSKIANQLLITKDSTK
ncbi:MAG: response regulator [Spirochaetes bacterium]|nr:response regulator [Spirochaetota bacterium]